MCTALISALTKIPVRSDVAMTGEIPDNTTKDLAEIPDNIKEKLDIRSVKWIDEVLRADPHAGAAAGGGGYQFGGTAGRREAPSQAASREEPRSLGRTSARKDSDRPVLRRPMFPTQNPGRGSLHDPPQFGLSYTSFPDNY
jgi:hypothetical protein